MVNLQKSKVRKIRVAPLIRHLPRANFEVRWSLVDRRGKQEEMCTSGRPRRSWKRGWDG